MAALLLLFLTLLSLSQSFGATLLHPLPASAVRQSQCAQSDSLCMALEMHRIHNGYRASAGRPAQAFNFRLHARAMYWTGRLADLGRRVSHSPEGYQRAHGIGQENVGSVFFGAAPADGGGAPARLMAWWWASPGHRRVILGDQPSVGIGVRVAGGLAYGAEMLGPLRPGDDRTAAARERPQRQRRREQRRAQRPRVRRERRERRM